MTPDDIEKLANVDNRSKSNAHRIDELEESTQALNELTTAVKVMVTKQDNLVDKVNCLDGKVTILESKRAKRWERLTEKLTWLFVGGVIMFCLSQIGI